MVQIFLSSIYLSFFNISQGIKHRVIDSRVPLFIVLKEHKKYIYIAFVFMFFVFSMHKCDNKTSVFVCFYMFADAIRAYGGGELTVTGPTATAGIFSTYPAAYLSVWGGVVDQVRYCNTRCCLRFHVTFLDVCERFPLFSR